MNKNLVITDDLKPILGILKEDDAKAVLQLKNELTDNWSKKQIFRTETEMRISVLNDGKHPTIASKYWQSVREQNAMFEALMGLSFELRRNKIQRRKLERELQECDDELRVEEIQVDLDENLYSRANMEQTAHDRVRELKLWSQIKSELDNGDFNTKDVNNHQMNSYKHALQNRVNSLGNDSSGAEIINAVGPLNTLNRLENEQLLKA